MAVKEVINNGIILIVDDDEAVAYVTGEMLRRLGYSVQVETESKLALNAFMEDPDGFGLIIADQRMPDMKGTEIAEKVLQVRPDMPVIVVSGTSSGTREEADGVGVLWLEKPLIKEELSRAVERALRS